MIFDILFSDVLFFDILIFDILIFNILLFDVSCLPRSELGPATRHRMRFRRGEGSRDLPLDHGQEPQLNPLRGRRAGGGHAHGPFEGNQVRNGKLPRLVQKIVQVKKTT